jgi:hypothetical protein
MRLPNLFGHETLDEVRFFLLLSSFFFVRFDSFFFFFLLLFITNPFVNRFIIHLTAPFSHLHFGPVASGRIQRNCAQIWQQASGWMPLFQLGCHPSTKLFLCSLFTPV